MRPDELPALKSYKSTPNFTQDSVPAGLLAEHSTKDGVWGLIHVTSGKLRYCVTDSRRKLEERVLEPGAEAGVVEPTILHRVEPIGAVEFHVEFLRAPTGERNSTSPRERGQE